MNFLQFYFSFKGRLSRFDYFLKAYLPIVIISLLASKSTYMLTPEISVADAVPILILWPAMATGTKRFHDFGVSGWQALFGYGILCFVGLLGVGYVLHSVLHLSPYIQILVFVPLFIAWILYPLLRPGDYGRNVYGVR